MPAPQKNFIRRILELRLFLVINLLVLFFLALSFGREFFRDYQIQHEIGALRDKAEELEVRNLEITELNAGLETEMFLEEEARLRLGLVDPGESVVVVVEEEQGSSVISSQLSVSEEPTTENRQLTTGSVSNPTRWYYYFFDRNQFLTIKTHGY